VSAPTDDDREGINMASIVFLSAAVFLAVGLGELRHRSLRSSRVRTSVPSAQRVRPATPTVETPNAHGLKGAAQHA
jgi:hypothetical protein